MHNDIDGAMRNPPFKGSSVPGDCAQALRYAFRLEQRFYNDHDKMMAAQVRLNALAEVCEAGHYPEMQGWLTEIAESLQ